MHTLRNRPLIVLLGAFFVLALIYAWATPIFEASDELWHFGVVNHIANTGELPVQVVGVETPWEQEGSQPPLYYLVAAALVAPIDRSDFSPILMQSQASQALSGTRIWCCMIYLIPRS
jgi:hypothetical protein